MSLHHKSEKEKWEKYYWWLKLVKTYISMLSLYFFHVYVIFYTVWVANNKIPIFGQHSKIVKPCTQQKLSTSYEPSPVPGRRTRTQQCPCLIELELGFRNKPPKGAALRRPGGWLSHTPCIWGPQEAQHGSLAWPHPGTLTTLGCSVASKLFALRIPNSYYWVNISIKPHPQQRNLWQKVTQFLSIPVLLVVRNLHTYPHTISPTFRRPLTVNKLLSPCYFHHPGFAFGGWAV